MNNNLIVMNNNMFGDVRFLNVDGKPYAVASDVAKALGYAKPNNAVNTHCKNATLKQGIIKDNLGRLQDVLIIPESDIYRLIIKSKLPKAQEFECWVMEEVLPQIRQTGGYIPVSQEDDEQELLAKAFLIAQKTIEKKEELLQQATKVIEEQKPLVEMAKDFLDKDGLVSVDDFAKNLAIKGLGRNNMYKYLREQKILMTDEWENPFTLKKMYGENHHKPYARFINEGKMVWKPTSYNTHTEKYNHKPYFTAQGVEYMLKKLRKNGYIK